MNATRDDATLRARAEKLGPWYHRIDLGGGVVTPGLERFVPVWDNIRRARAHLDYRGASVLDVGSMEGMWAFEAEALGAAFVVATDCYLEEGGFGDPLERFLLCHAALGSRVVPYYNVSPYRLAERLDLVLHERWPDRPAAERRFDVVHHLGVLYHLRDPMLSLLQARSVLRSGGRLLIETVVVADEPRAFLLFNGVPPDPPRIYSDVTTWWAPTLPCLWEMLRASLLRPVEETFATTPPYHEGEVSLQRAALVCEAVGEETLPPRYARELRRTYRNPGLEALPPDD